MRPWNASAAAPSRRSFLRSSLGLAGAAVTLPIVTEAHLAWAATGGVAPSRVAKPSLPADAVLINANENPLGPSAAACQAIARMAPLGGRYDVTGQTDQLTATFAEQNRLKPEYVAVYAGSSEPLHYAVLAFTNPTRGYVTADPSYEAGMVAAMAARARISKVHLTPDYAHDLRAMVAADSHAGLIYICNPNNPTGTLTPRAEIEWALDHKPKGSVLLVDEAYIHLCNAPSVLDLVAADRDLIVLRTFSKVYGMAGIRCGLALGRPDLLKRLQPYGMNAMPITAAAAANASLGDPELVSTRKQLIATTREQTFTWLDANGYQAIPSVSNCFMIQTGRPGKAVIQAMQAENVYIGRTWPVWPNAVRVSVGTPEDMQRFQVAFKKVMDAAPPAIAARLHDPLSTRHFPALS